MLATKCIDGEGEQAWVFVGLLNPYGIEFYVVTRSARNLGVKCLDMRLTTSKGILVRCTSIVRNLYTPILAHRVVVKVDI